MAQHAGLCSTAEWQQEQSVCSNHLMGLHSGQCPWGFHLERFFPWLLNLATTCKLSLIQVQAVNPRPFSKKHKVLQHHLFSSSSLFLSEVFFPTTVTNQIPGAPSDASISTVTSPATTEMSYTIIALASSITATTYQNKETKEAWKSKDWFEF